MFQNSPTATIDNVSVENYSIESVETVSAKILKHLNGHATFLTADEITSLAKRCINASNAEINALTNKKLRKKASLIPTVFKVVTPEEEQIIRKSEPNSGHIINICTNPASVSIDDIPIHDQKVWSYRQENLLIIYKKLLTMLQTSTTKNNANIEKAIKAIRHGEFSHRCQNSITKFVSAGGIIPLHKTVRCTNNIELAKFLVNPLVRTCGHC